MGRSTMTDDLRYSDEIKTKDWSERASLLLCPRCGADLLHHSKVAIFDRGEDASNCVKTEVFGGKVSVDPAASGAGNPSSRRDGIAIDFWCEGCGEDPLQLTIAQHKGSTEIGWRYKPQ